MIKLEAFSVINFNKVVTMAKSNILIDFKNGVHLKKIIHFLLVISLFCPYALDAKEKCVRGCMNCGFFAEFLWVINHLQYCEATNKTPVIYWDNKFAYYSPHGYNGSENCWEYYFEPVSNLKYKSSDPLHRHEVYNNFTSIWWYCQYIQNIHLLSPQEQKSIVGVQRPFALSGDNKLYPSACGHLYGKEVRHYVKYLIDKFIKIKPSIKNKITSFVYSQMHGHHVVGIHLRGSFIFNEVGTVPLEMLCAEANKIANKNTIFYVATDQAPLLEGAKKLLKGKVIAYNAYRQETTTSPVAPGQWPPEMGEDVLIETILLASCNHLVHTISNVSTAALYFNPDLPHTTLYCAGVN